MKKRIFRVFAPLVAFALLAVTALSPGTVSAQDAEVTCPEGEASVVMLSNAVGNELEVAEDQAQAFMEICPNVNIEVRDVPDSATDRLVQYLQFLEAESSEIDIYTVDVIWPAIVAEHMVDLNEYIDQEKIDQFFPAMIANNTVDGQLVAMPSQTGAPMLYYRADLLDQYGVEVPTTWDELTVAAETVQAAVRAETGNEDFSGFVWQGDAYEGLTCDAHEWIIAETGETFISPEGEVNVNNEQVIDAVERAADWVNGISPEGITTFQEEDARLAFIAGDAAFMRNWPYAYTSATEEGLDFGIVPLPVGDSGRAGGCLGGWNLAVSQYSENPEAAAAVVDYFTSYDALVERAVRASTLPTMPAVYDDEEVIASAPVFAEDLGAVVETAYPRPSVITAERYNEASTLFYTAVHNVLTGEQDAATSLAQLETDLQGLLEEMGTMSGEEEMEEMGEMDTEATEEAED